MLLHLQGHKQRFPRWWVENRRLAKIFFNSSIPAVWQWNTQKRECGKPIPWFQPHWIFRCYFPDPTANNSLKIQPEWSDRNNSRNCLQLSFGTFPARIHNSHCTMPPLLPRCFRVRRNSFELNTFWFEVPSDSYWGRCWLVHTWFHDFFSLGTTFSIQELKVGNHLSSFPFRMKLIT